MRKKIVILFLFSLFANCIFAVSLNDLKIVAEDGTFLGTFENEYASNSIYNQYGNYGSPHGAKSIFNKFSNYGSDYSQYSPFNQYATKAPGLYDKRGNFYGMLSVNRYAQGVTDYTYKLARQLKAMRDSM